MKDQGSSSVLKALRESRVTKVDKTKEGKTYLRTCKKCGMMETVSSVLLHTPCDCGGKVFESFQVSMNGGKMMRESAVLGKLTEEQKKAGGKINEKLNESRVNMSKPAILSLLTGSNAPNNIMEAYYAGRMNEVSNYLKETLKIEIAV